MHVLQWTLNCVWLFRDYNAKKANNSNDYLVCNYLVIIIIYLLSTKCEHILCVRMCPHLVFLQML
jgi:hypothetical protein